MTRGRFHHQIEACLDDVATMLGLVESAVFDVTRAVVESDVRAAEQVISRDEQVNALYRAVDVRAYELLAREAPVAGDLRALLSAIRMIGDVERAGDLTLTIAKAVRRTAAIAITPAVAGLVADMGAQAAGLLRASRVALLDREPETAERLDLVDDILDDLAEAMVRTFTSERGGPSTELAMSMAVVARCYERIGDHAVAVAERVEFLVTGVAHTAHVGL